MEGVLITEPWNKAWSSDPFFVMRKILGKGRFSGVKDSKRSTARGLRMMVPCAPSPPSAFCHEYLYVHQRQFKGVAT